ncbi:MAG: SusC/RagA family TonB-linked outer membrane protein [Gemmatimonadota bacterium]
MKVPPAIASLALLLVVAAGATTRVAAQQAPRTQQANLGSVTGTVTRDGSTTPIDQAQVKIVGTSLGALTNAQGRYTIPNVSPGIYAVEAIRIGMAPKRVADVRVTAGTPTTVNIGLAERALMLDAVVATGLTDPVSGAKAPFSVARLSAADLPVPSTGDALAGLSGKVAGVTIRAGAQPGSDLSIQLRAPTSFRGNTQPMIIVDGVIQLQDDPSLQSRGIAGSDLDLNPEDIASVEVVRGAAAAALYGQRAASGVIVIKTKRGESTPQNTTTIMLTNETGMSRVGNRIPVTKSHRFLVDPSNQFIDIFGRPTLGRNYVLDPDGFIDNRWGVPTYDHLDQMFGSGSTMSNNLSISQSSLSTNFNVQVGGSSESGILKTPKGGVDRYNIRINLDHRVGDKLSLGFGTYYNRQFQRVSGEGAANTILRAFDIGPDIDLRAIDPSTGRYIAFPDGTNAATFNPIFGELQRDSWNKRAGLQSSMDVTYRPTSFLSLTSQFGYQRSDRQAQLQFLQPGTFNNTGTVSPGELDIAADFDESFNGEVRAQLLKALGSWTARSSVAVLGTIINNNGWEVRGDTLLQPQADLDFGRRFEADQVIRDQRTRSYNVTAGVDYKAKYIFDALYRKDGNSLFPPSSRWNDNMRVSGAWLLAEEPWWKFEAIPSFKLRYSLGTAGNNPLFADQYETYAQNAGTERIFKQDMGNIALVPEKVTEQEVGFDMNIKNRFGLQFSFVRVYTQNAIRADTISSYTGFDTQVKNLGDLLGRTYEATLEAQWVQRRNFSWSSTLVVDRSRIKIAKYPRLCGAADGGSLERECEGYVFGELWGASLARDANQLSPRHVTSNSLGQFQQNDDGLLVAVGPNGSWTDGKWGQNVVVDGITYQWGMPIIVGNYDAAGLRAGNKAVRIGQSNPDAQIGLTNTVVLGNWNFFMQMTGQLGGLLYNRARERLYDIEVHEDVDQAGKPAHTKKPSVYYTNNPVAASGSTGLAPGVRVDWFAEESQYLKIAELQARYRFDKVPGVLGSVGIKRASVALTARNLFSFTKYSGQDPEAGTATSRVDDIAYPRYRTFSLRTQFIF